MVSARFHVIGILVIGFYFFAVWGFHGETIVWVVVSQVLWILFVEREKEERRECQLLQELSEYFEIFRVSCEKSRKADEAMEFAWYQRSFSFMLKPETHSLLAKLIVICDCFEQSNQKEEISILCVTDELKEEAREELMKHHQLKYEFSGGIFLIWGALLLIKPIEQWAVGNITELREYYSGHFGVIIRIVTMTFIYICWYGFLILRYPSKQKKDQFASYLEYLFQVSFVKGGVIWFINIAHRSCQNLNQWLAYVGHPMYVPQFLLFQFICAMAGGIGVGCLLAGFPIKVFHYFLLCLISVILGAFFPYLSILYYWSELSERKEEEVVWYFQLLNVIKTLPNYSQDQIIMWLLKVPGYFTSYLEGILVYSELLSEKSEAELWTNVAYSPFIRMIDMISNCDSLPIEEALASTQEENEYVKHMLMIHQNQKIRMKIFLGRGSVLAPSVLVMMTQLIVPFVLEGLRQLSMYAGGMQW